MKRFRLAKRALQIREKLLPRTDAQVSSSLTNLGEIYIARKDYKPAKEVFLRLLQIQEELFGPEDANLSFTLDRLAVLNFVAGNYDETEAAYKRSLALRERALGENDPLVAQSLFSLGEYYRFRREIKPCFRELQTSVDDLWRPGRHYDSGVCACRRWSCVPRLQPSQIRVV